MGLLTMLTGLKSQVLLIVIGILLVTGVAAGVMGLFIINKHKETIIDLKDKVTIANNKLSTLKDKIRTEALRFQKELADSRMLTTALRESVERQLDSNLSKSIDNLPNVNSSLNIPVLKIPDTICKEEVKHTEEYYRDMIKEFKTTTDNYSMQNINELRNGQ